MPVGKQVSGRPRAPKDGRAFTHDPPFGPKLHGGLIGRPCHDDVAGPGQNLLDAQPVVAPLLDSEGEVVRVAHNESMTRERTGSREARPGKVRKPALPGEIER